MTLSDIAPHVGIAALVINTTFAIVYFLKHRRRGKKIESLRSRNDALVADNAGLRAQNVRLIQTVASLRGEIREVERLMQNFDPKKEV